MCDQPNYIMYGIAWWNHPFPALFVRASLFCTSCRWSLNTLWISTALLSPLKVSLGNHQATFFVVFSFGPCCLDGDESPRFAPVDKYMTQVRWVKVTQVTGQPPSVSDWFRSVHGGLIRGNLRGFVPTVKGKVNFHFSCYTVSQPGDHQL